MAFQSPRNRVKYYNNYIPIIRACRAQGFNPLEIGSNITISNGLLPAHPFSPFQSPRNRVKYYNQQLTTKKVREIVVSIP